MLASGLPPERRRRGGGRVLDQSWGRGEPLKVSNPEPVQNNNNEKKETNKQTKNEVTIPSLGQHSHFYYSLFRTNEKMNAVSFLSHLLAILIEKFKVRVIAFENLEHEQISSNKSTPSFWQYPVPVYNSDRLAQSYIPCLGKSGQERTKTIPCSYKPYKRATCGGGGWG